MIPLFNVQLVKGFWARLEGFKSTNLPSQPALYFPRCKAIHTFGVNPLLDLYWLDKDGKILRVDQRIGSARLKFCFKAYGVVETKTENFQTLKVGDRFKLPGQALVESAFVLPVLFLLLFGFLELSLALQEQQRLVHSVHLATQIASLTNNDQKLAGALDQQYDLSQLIVSIENFSATTSQPISSSERRYNDLVRVEMRSPYTLRVPFLKIDAFKLSAQAQARIVCQNSVAPYQCD